MLQDEFILLGVLLAQWSVYPSKFSAATLSKMSVTCHLGAHLRGLAVRHG